ncbi:class I SAM-dependent methyltransferase [Hyphococcus sp.]|uniref:class I SAM-dependent methyltransferase n=1 Tax=Hyphococcus sp. TaxID=2038636 RepID=UPI003CCBD6DD
MTAVKRAARAALNRLGLIGLYFWLLERRKSYGREAPPAADERGVPIPPLAMMARVVAHADWRAFLKTGEASAKTLDHYAAQGGVPFAEARRILDFGCGCGRVVRHLPAMSDAEIYGVDYNGALADWCAQNLDGRFSRNRLAPPLDFPDGHFDVVYLISVFTHLRIETQRQWLAELRRVTRSGGAVIITFHDEAHRGLPQSEAAAAALSDKGFYIQNDMAEGSNLIATFQTRAFTQTLFAEHFEIVRIIASPDCPLRQAAAILRVT